MLHIHKQRTYVLGMEWADFVTAGDAKKHIQQKKKPYVRIDVTDGQNSFAVGTCSEHVKGHVFSAAMVVGFIYPNCIIYHPLADGLVWFAVVASGVPYAGRDSILPQAEADVLLREHMSYVQDIVGDITGAKSTLENVLDVFENQLIDGQISKKQLRQSELRKLFTPVQIILMSSLALLITMGTGGSLIAYQKMVKESTSRDSAFASLLQSKAAAEKAEADKKRLVTQFEDQIADKRAEFQASLHGPMDQWMIWEEVRKALPLSVKGYRPQTMECNAEKCMVSWLGTGIGVKFKDKSAIPGWIVDSEPNFLAQSEYHLNQVRETETILVSLQTVTDVGALRLQIAQAAQVAQSFQLSVAESVILVPPPNIGLSPVTVGQKGTLRVGMTDSKSIVDASDVFWALRKFPIKLKSVHWAQLSSATPSADVTGFYFFQI